MNLNLNDYQVLVTGSSRGIGKAIARCFLEEGADVTLTGREVATLNEAKADLIPHAQGQLNSFAGDLSDQKTLNQLAETLQQDKRGIDTLVCNVGSGKVPGNFTENVDDWYQQFEINLFTTVKTIKTLWDLLASARANKHKSIICISSICGYENLGGPVSYSAAKAALNSFVKNIMRPSAAAGIRVNVVSPGNIIFPGSTWEKKLKETPQQVAQMLKTEVPLQRLGEPNDIAHAVTFLASEKARFITGANWVIDGGQTRSY